VLERGPVVEHGPPDELAAREGAYANLLRLQNLDGRPEPIRS
jgi:ABC-type multidrug transport system fused ATPase/permease subunit